MMISKITTINSNNSKNKRRKILETTAILAGTTAIFPAGFLVADNFSNSKRNYTKKVEEEINKYKKTVEKRTNAGLNLLNRLGNQANASEKEEVRALVEQVEKAKLENRLVPLKQIRKMYLKNGLKISAGLGISIGVITLALKNAYENHKSNQIDKSPNTNNTNNTTVNLEAFSNKKKQINFTGIVDKIANELNSQQLKKFHDYINGILPLPTIEEMKLAQQIAKVRIKDWPKGIKNTFSAKFLKPSSDEKYQTFLLKQEIEIPPEPPMYYRNYDKLFNTKRYQAYLTWPKYIDQSARYERMENIIKRERIRSYAQEKALFEQLAKKELSLACVKYRINDEFLKPFNSNEKRIKIPDALMVQGENKDETIETLKWIVGKSDSNYTYIEDKNEPNNIRLNQILTVLEEAEENYKKNGKRTLLWIENFEKLLINTSENEDVIGDLKDMLDKISKQYKTTIIFSCIDTKKLNPVVLQPHRVKIYNLSNETPLEELKKIQKEYILSNIKNLQNSDGYRFKYTPFENNFVDLYLGDFSCRPDILWVDSQNAEAIKAVIKNFDTIKKIPKFKDIKSLKFPKPNDLKDFDNNKLMCSGNITKDGKVIYEYFV